MIGMCVMSKINAAYTRYSSFNQRETSITDQETGIKKKYAEFGVPEDQIVFFADEALSGENVTRPQYDKLMALVEDYKVAMIVVDDQSRLTREMNIDELIKKFRFYGVRFLTKNGDVDSNDASKDVNAKVRGLVNNLSNSDHANRVRRGLEGRARDVNGAAGDHPYGYLTDWVDRAEGTKYIANGGNGPKPLRATFIFEEEAEVIRDVFRLFVVEGLSLNGIARKLNARKISPGKRSGAKKWSAGRVRTLLQNEKYAGVWTWGENRTVKYKNQRRDQKADVKDVVRVERPHLAIVTREMWEGSVKRFERFKEILGPLSGKAKNKRLGMYAREQPTTLLGGVLLCNGCGTRLRQGAGNGGRYYHCPEHAKGGDCKSKSSASKPKAEQAVIGFLQEQLTTIDDWFELVYAEVLRNIEAHDARIPAETENLLRRKVELEREIDTLAANLAGMVSQSLTAKLVSAEKALAEVEEGLESMERNRSRKRELPSKADVAAELSNLVSVMSEQPKRGCLLLRKIIGRIRVKDVICPGWEEGYAELSFRFDPMRLLSVVYEQGCLFNADVELPMAKDVVLFTGEPTALQLAMPQIHEWRQQNPSVPWLEIHRRTGHSASCAGVYYARWCKAKGYTPA